MILLIAALFAVMCLTGPSAAQAPQGMHPEGNLLTLNSEADMQLIDIIVQYPVVITPKINESKDFYVNNFGFDTIFESD